MELVKVDTERHSQHVAGTDAVELFAREGRRAHHGVVIRRGPAIGEIRDRAGDGTRNYLPDKAIQSFMRDHHGGNIIAASPRPEGTQRQPV
jgi:hypothetical protein